ATAVFHPHGPAGIVDRETHAELHGQGEVAFRTVHEAGGVHGELHTRVTGEEGAHHLGATGGELGGQFGGYTHDVAQPVVLALLPLHQVAPVHDARRGR